MRSNSQTLRVVPGFPIVGGPSVTSYKISDCSRLSTTADHRDYRTLASSFQLDGHPKRRGGRIVFSAAYDQVGRLVRITGTPEEPGLH